MPNHQKVTNIARTAAKIIAKATLAEICANAPDQQITFEPDALAELITSTAQRAAAYALRFRDQTAAYHVN